MILIIVKYSKLNKRGEKMLRLEEVCNLYKISKPTLYTWIELGLPVYRVGKIPFFEEKEIVEFIKKNKEVK